MTDFPYRLRSLREKRGWRQKDVAEKLGISESAYGYYEQGRREPSNDTLRQLADIFNVKIDYLLGRTDNPTENEIQKIIQEQGFELVPIPILGVIHAGDPIPAEENIIGYTAIPKYQAKGGTFFALRVIGDCMAGARKPIEEGDLVIVRKQPTVENGEIAVVMWPEVNEAQLRRVYFRDGHVILRSDNPEYPPEVVRHRDLQIIGKVEGIISSPAAANEV